MSVSTVGWQDVAAYGSASLKGYIKRPRSAPRPKQAVYLSRSASGQRGLFCAGRLVQEISREEYEHCCRSFDHFVAFLDCLGLDFQPIRHPADGTHGAR